MVELWAPSPNTRYPEGDPVRDGLVINLLSVVPKRRTARFMGASTRVKLPGWLNRALLRWYIRTYKVDMSECVGSLEDFPSLSQFFIRELKPGIRPVDPDPEVLVSPVDGTVHTFGRIEEGRFVQVDGQTASVWELLGAGDPRAPDAAAVWWVTGCVAARSRSCISVHLCSSRLAAISPKPRAKRRSPFWASEAATCSR